MQETFLNQVHRFRRVWRMGKLGHTLIVLAIVLFLIAIAVSFTETNGLIKGLCWASVALLLILIIDMAGQSNLKVVWFQGGPQPVKREFDYPEHTAIGEAIAGYVVTVKNTGGTKLFLEPKLILIDHKTHEPLIGAIDMLPNPSKTKERYYKSDTSKRLYQSPSYCDKTLELNKDEDQKTVLMEFLIDKFWVERLGNNWSYRLYNAKSILRLIDRGNNIMFQCFESEAGKYTCKKSKINSG